MPRHAPRGAIKGKPEGADLMGDTDPKARKLRCTAKSKTSGRQCAQPPILGGTVCRYHGGAAPQVAAKARDRLMALQDPAIDTLGYLMSQRAAFPSTAYAAARDVLDRTEGKPKESIDMNVTGEIALVPERLAAARKRLSQKA